MKNLWPRITLEESVQRTVERVGVIGVVFDFQADNLFFRWRVRVLDENSNLLPSAPYSLTFLSICCRENIMFNSRTDPTHVQCMNCKLTQEHIDNVTVLSLLGRNREASIGRIANAYAQRNNVTTLDGLEFAMHVVGEIQRVHAKYLTSEWAASTAKKISVKYPRQS